VMHGIEWLVGASCHAGLALQYRLLLASPCNVRSDAALRKQDESTRRMRFGANAWVQKRWRISPHGEKGTRKVPGVVRLHRRRAREASRDPQRGAHAMR